MGTDCGYNFAGARIKLYSFLLMVCVENHKMGFLRAPVCGCTNSDYTANLACNLRAAPA